MSRLLMLSSLSVAPVVEIHQGKKKREKDEKEKSGKNGLLDERVIESQLSKMLCENGEEEKEAILEREYVPVLFLGILTYIQMVVNGYVVFHYMFS